MSAGKSHRGRRVARKVRKPRIPKPDRLAHLEDKIAHVQKKTLELINIWNESVAAANSFKDAVLATGIVRTKSANSDCYEATCSGPFAKQSVITAILDNIGMSMVDTPDGCFFRRNKS